MNSLSPIDTSIKQQTIVKALHWSRLHKQGLNKCSILSSKRTRLYRPSHKKSRDSRRRNSRQKNLSHHFSKKYKKPSLLPPTPQPLLSSLPNSRPSSLPSWPALFLLSSTILQNIPKFIRFCFKLLSPKPTLIFRLSWKIRLRLFAEFCFNCNRMIKKPKSKLFRRINV